MYKNQFSRSKRYGSFSYKQSSKNGPPKTRFAKGGFGSRNRVQNKNRSKRQTGAYIHPSSFVNKAAPSMADGPYVPQHQFSDFAVAKELKVNIAAKGYRIPTAIQDRTIEPVLLGRDVVGIANTGTGKTAAFLIPLINKVLRERREKVLVVVPTRELALQIDQELRDFARTLGIFSVCAVGGASIGPQIAQLKRKNNFIIGTPGRLKDLVNRGNIRLSEFQTVVLDEADRMLDMGFIADIRFLIDRMPQVRHTLFFSATLSPDIEKLIGAFLRDPVRISTKTGNTAKTIDQDIVTVRPGTTKLDTLHDLLGREEFSKVLVFGRTKHGVERLSRDLAKRGVTSESIHGNKTHGQRQKALRNFKENKVQVLVATDVAARGLDIADISHVINYDIPTTYEDYVHRIGRTGRADKPGKALTFIE